MLTSMRNRKTRTITQSLVVFLFKLRTGNSNRILVFILQLENEQLISEYSTAVMKSFAKDVLPHRFGINNEFQKKKYSGQKKVKFVKGERTDDDQAPWFVRGKGTHV